jgi:ribosomal protein S21
MDDKKKAVELPINVQVDYGFEKMLKSFLKQVEKYGTLDELRKRRYYVKPSEQKRLGKNGRQR